MFRNVGKLLEQFDANFMISGEVIGQRPMSQRKESLDNVKSLSTYNDLVVRPLCAKLLEPSLPELEGWIDREKLLDINGRNRNKQLELAEQIGLKDFESPGGGCLLTDESFSDRLRDFVNKQNLEVEDIDTLKAGRHFRLQNGAKLIIGRHKEDNEKLEKIVNKKYYRAKIQDATGPYSLLEKKATKQERELATTFIVSYGKTQLNQDYTVNFTSEDENFTLQGQRLPSKNEIAKYLV
jgi:tRNA-specific 2-thiouridylase